jgi:ribosomal protein S27AE
MSNSTTGQRNGNNNQILGTKIPEPETEQEEEVLLEQLNFEIECPRCGDVMELFSEFDHLSYYCGDCRLELNVN